MTKTSKITYTAIFAAIATVLMYFEFPIPFMPPFLKVDLSGAVVLIGAFIFGMTSLGIIYAGWDPNWFKAFLGVMLLLAVLVNLYVKRISTMRKVG